VTYSQNIGEWVKIYIDGVLSGEQANVKAWWWPTGLSVLLGKSRDAYWKKLHGSLDDVRFYNRIMTDAEVTQLATGAVVDDAAMVLLLNFDNAPANGFRLTTTPSSAKVQASGAVDGGYVPLGSSPYFYIPSGPAQFFRAIWP
jgi:hypothetical protein